MSLGKHLNIFLEKINRLRNLITFIFFFMLCRECIAQQDTTPLFKRFPVVPPITLLKSDNTVITKERLKKNQPLILMFFSPECHHCTKQIEDMLARMDDLRKVHIVLATYRSMEELVSFQKKYKLANYPNIECGRDTKYFIQPFYKVRNLPYLALYDKKGSLITTYEGNVTVDKLVESLK
jgi:thioredoxin-related protein